MVKHKAYVNKNICLSCGGCVSVCPQDALQLINMIADITSSKCIGCKICMTTCPVAAISMKEVK